MSESRMPTAPAVTASYRGLRRAHVQVDVANDGEALVVLARRGLDGATVHVIHRRIEQTQPHGPTVNGRADSDGKCVKLLRGGCSRA